METCGFSYLIQNWRTSFYFRMAYGIRVQHCPNSKGNPKRRTTTKWNLTTGWVRYHSKCNYRMVTPTNQKEKQDFEHNIYQLIGQVSRLYRATNKQKEHRWRSVPAPTAIGHSPQRNAAVIQDSKKSAQRNRTTPLSVLGIHHLIIPPESCTRAKPDRKSIGVLCVKRWGHNRPLTTSYSNLALIFAKSVGVGGPQCQGTAPPPSLSRERYRGVEGRSRSREGRSGAHL